MSETYSQLLKEKKAIARSYINANVWDGEDRSGCKGDGAGFDPDELQELIDDLVECLYSKDGSTSEPTLNDYRAWLKQNIERLIEDNRATSGKYYSEIHESCRPFIQSIEMINAFEKEVSINARQGLVE